MRSYTNGAANTTMRETATGTRASTGADGFRDGTQTRVFATIGVFVLVTFVLTILFALAQQLVRLGPARVSLPQLGPGAAALLMLILFRHDQMRLRLTPSGVPLRKYLAALSIPLLAPMVLFLAYRRFVAPISIEPIDAGSLIVLMTGILIGAVGEEIGWRGYAQRLLERRVHAHAASVIIGVLWAVWHIGKFSLGPLYMLLFICSSVGYSITMAWLIRGTDYNVPLASLFHFGINVGFYILQDAVSDIRLVAMNGVLWLILSTTVITIDRRNVRHTPARLADATPS
jgi:membrane protease YdiL (CAAX protease family)